MKNYLKNIDYCELKLPQNKIKTKYKTICYRNVSLLVGGLNVNTNHGLIYKSLN